MPIKHLVLCGGGYLGLYHLGALTRLLNVGYIKRENITTIHGTSIGAFFGTVFCMNVNWDTTIEYFIKRPWNKVLTITPNKVFQAISKKGLYDKETFDKLIIPLIKSRNFDETLTLEQLYEISNVTLYMYTINLNTFTLEEISHHTHPKLTVLDALYMTCSLPYLFQPLIKGDKCYIDGGLINNYPIRESLHIAGRPEEVLGIRFQGSRSIQSINESHNVFEYGYFLYRTLIQNIRNTDYPEIPHEIVIPCRQTNMSDGSNVAASEEERSQYMALGSNYADRFLATIDHF